MLPEWFLQRFKDRAYWRQFNDLLQINLKRHYVYVETPKVACSTIKRRLLDDAVGQLPPVKKIHPPIHETPLIKPYQLGDELMISILDGAEYYRFTFLREPTERVVSAYLDKITRDVPIRDRFLTMFLPDHDPTQKVEFGQFLDALLSIQDFREFDKHWRPQSELIFDGELKLDFIGCFARFEDDWEIVRNEIGLPKIPIPESIRWHATSASDISDELVTPEAQKKIEKIYGRDFELYEQVLHHKYF